MIDSVSSSSTSILSSDRTTALQQTARLRSTDVLTAIQQTQQRDSSSPMRVFSVPQASGPGALAGASTSKLPRGSLVDFLA